MILSRDVTSNEQETLSLKDHMCKSDSVSSIVMEPNNKKLIQSWITICAV